METKFVQLLYYSDSYRKYHQKRPKMHVLIVFCFDFILNTDAVVDHLPESIKIIKFKSIKFVGSHDIKKQLLYCLA